MRTTESIELALLHKADCLQAVGEAGVSIGEDGPSQMALEDLAMMRAVYGSTVFYPCDGNQTAKLVRIMVDLPGISYIRTTREKTPILYTAHEEFQPGGSKVSSVKPLELAPRTSPRLPADGGLRAVSAQKYGSAHKLVYRIMRMHLHDHKAPSHVCARNATVNKQRSWHTYCCDKGRLLVVRRNGRR